MKRLISIAVFSILCGCFFPSNGYAQESYTSDKQSVYLDKSVSERSLDKEKWQKITRRIDYSSNPSERKKKEQSFKEFIESYRNQKGGGAPDKSFFDFERPQISAPMFGGGPMSYILMGLVIALLAVLIVKIILEANKNKNIPQKKVLSNVDLEKLEENIHETDLQRLLKQVLEEKDYKLAIRIHYLMIIRKLSDLEWIDWRKNKTNLEYLTEVSERPIYQAFQQLTYVFERIWYGELEIGEREYRILAPKFEELVR